MNQTTDIRDYYTRYSTWYEGERRAGYYGLINGLEIDMIHDEVRDAEVLEVGCGPGIILDQIAPLAKSAVGIDLSPGMVEQATAKGLDVREASATSLPFPDNSFDVVYAFKSLPHVPDITTAIAEVDRVLRPNGVAYLEFYNPWSLKSIANRLSRRLGKKGVFIRYEGLRQIRANVAEHFDVGRIRGVRIFAPTRHAYTLPGIRRVFSWLERRSCDNAFLARFGGYLVVELRPHQR